MGEKFNVILLKFFFNVNVFIDNKDNKILKSQIFKNIEISYREIKLVLY